MLTLNGFGLLQRVLESSATGSGRLPPCNFAAPELVGKAEVGATVSARPGVWAGLPVPEIKTTLFLGGVACPSPYLIGPEDDGKEIVVTDVATNGAGGATVSSPRVLVQHPVPQALGVPEDISIKSETVVVDTGQLFVGTSGGQWSAACAAGADALQLEIDETGRMTLGAGMLIGSAAVSVSYANSGGSTSAIFTVSSGDVERVEAPKYDGSLGDLSITSGDLVSIEAGLAFSGTGLFFSATGLPDGVVADSESGRIAGQASRIGSYGVAVSATNTAGSAEGAFKLDIIERPQPLPDAPTYDGSLQASTAILGGTFELSAGSAFTGESLSFAATGLPPDLVVDAGTGGITGTLSSTGEFAVTVTASNPGGEASGTFALTVSDPPLVAPAYDGSLQTTETTLGVAFALNAGDAFTGDALSFSAQGLVPGLTIDAATGQVAGAPATEGTFATTITARNSAGEASGSFQMVVAAPGTATPAAPTYNGGAADLVLEPNVAMKPVDMAVHFTGAGLSYSATGLPAGLSIDKATGVISGTPSAGAASVTVTASNTGGTAQAVFAISAGQESSGGEGGGESVSPGTASVESTGMMINVDNATIGIGSDEPGREIYFSVLLGGVEDAGLTVNGGAANLSLVAADSYPKRTAQAYRAVGLTGSTATIAVSSAADAEYVAAFKTVGYRPASGDPWITARQTSGNANPATLDVTVPAGGVVLLHGKRYDLLSASPPGTVIDARAPNGMRGYWRNTTGASTSVRFTFATSSAANEKYAAALILEKLS